MRLGRDASPYQFRTGLSALSGSAVAGGRRPRRFVLRLHRAGLDAAGYNNADGEVHPHERREPFLLCGRTLEEDRSLLRSLRSMRSLRLTNPGIGGLNGCAVQLRRKTRAGSSPARGGAEGDQGTGPRPDPLVPISVH